MLRELWEDWKWSLCIDPLEHSVTFLCGALFAAVSIILAVFVPLSWLK